MGRCDQYAYNLLVFILIEFFFAVTPTIQDQATRSTATLPDAVSRSSKNP